MQVHASFDFGRGNKIAFPRTVSRYDLVTIGRGMKVSVAAVVDRIKLRKMTE